MSAQFLVPSAPAHSLPPTVVVTVPAQQAAPVPQANASNTQQQKHQASLRGLAIAELLLGVICVILGAVVSGVVQHTIAVYTHLYHSQLNNNHDNYNRYNYNRYGSNYNNRYYNRPTIDEYYRYRYLFNIGEGIWCGSWIIIAGALGIRAAKIDASRCAINAHLALSILATIFCGMLVIIGGIGAAIANAVTIVVILNSLLCIAAFTCMILHIISSCYCCASLGCCCSSVANYSGQPIAAYGGQAMCNPRSNAVGMNGIAYAQQPTMQFQGGVSNFQQGYAPQSSQQHILQTTFPGYVATPSTGHQLNQVVNPTDPRIQPTGATKALEPPLDLPPSYNFASPR